MKIPKVLRALAVSGLLLPAVNEVYAVPPVHYIDGRPQAALRMEAVDEGVVLRHGNGPGGCDALGAREAIVFEWKGTYYLHYDGAGPKGWLACLATSKDLAHWRKHGPILDFGAAGALDSASASSPWVFYDGTEWHMFYVGTPNATSAPNFIPAFPYLTMKARSEKPGGPWQKQYDAIPFRPKPDSYYSSTASPGCVVKRDRTYSMFFSASTGLPDIKRTLSIARTKDLNGSWTVDASPILPASEQVENSSIYYEPANKTWFLFTNHIGINDRHEEFTDAVWVYWSQDLEHWDARRKAVVLDGKNCAWSHTCIGMPSVIKAGQRLALLYDGPGGDSNSHMGRDIGLAWLKLPLRSPAEN